MWSVTRRLAGRRYASTLTPSSISHIETRWAKLPEAEQGAIADQLAAAQKGDWKKLTIDEKRAAYYIAYGPYGARNPRDPAFNISVASWSGFFVLLSGVGYLWWQTQKPTLKSLSPEWKAESDRLSIEQKQDPYKGAYAKERK